MSKPLKIGIVLAAVIFFVCFLIEQWLFPNPNPRTAFEQLVVKPIPDSVGLIEQGSFITMDSVLRVLHFQVSKPDLKTLLDGQHFSPIDEVEAFKRWDVNSKSEVKIEKEEYLDYWKKQIHQAAKLDVSFGKSWQIFVLKEGRGIKYLFFDTNSTEVVFVADAH